MDAAPATPDGLERLVALIRAGGGGWEETLVETALSRERDLPRLHDIVDRFLAGDLTAAAFRQEMDSFGKQTRFAGFQGTAQMFFNLLVKAADEEKLARALRLALPEPADEGGVPQKFTDFLEFVEEVRERAAEMGLTKPGLGYVPYFLSFFWEARDRENWPIYYPASRDTLSKFGLFVDSGAYADRYLRFREQTQQLKDVLHTDTWGLEGALWHLKQAETAATIPEPAGTEPQTPEPADIYESIRSRDLFFPDEVVTSLVLSLSTKPFVLLSGISGTGKTQLAVGLAEYLEQRKSSPPVELEPPTGDENDVFIRLTKARLELGRTNLTKEHQTSFALHGALPEWGKYIDFSLALPDGSTGKLRLNNIGFSDASRKLYLLFFRSPANQWLRQNAEPGDYLHLRFGDDDEIGEVSIVRAEDRSDGIPASRHQVIAVRSDWTDPRGLIGFDNPITGTYAGTDLLNLLLRANSDAESPYLVILDEMNLARVEYYFSDFLSAMELADGAITLRASLDSSEATDDPVPDKLPLPTNALFLGTVNVDETTFSFSPKVLDRANVLVFNTVDAQRFLEQGGDTSESTFRLRSGALDPSRLADRSAANAEAFDRAREISSLSEAVLTLITVLEEHNRHFGYRVLREITTFVGHALILVDGEEDDIWQTALDLQITQKVLPKFNGGRELAPVLSALLAFCQSQEPKAETDWGTDDGDEPTGTATEAAATPVTPGETKTNDKYPRSAQALERMLERLNETGFVAFLE